MKIGRKFGKKSNRLIDVLSVEMNVFRSLKFHSNRHIATETEFYYSKGFFPVAFDETFQKIEILGETIQNIPMKMLILLPRFSRTCSSKF